MGVRSGRMTGMRATTTKEPYILAAHVTGNVTTDPYLSGKDPKTGKDEKPGGAAKDAKSTEAAGKNGKKAKEAEDDSLAGKEPAKTKINVVLVADIDWIRLRYLPDS